ncbi:TPA: hypothetical protein N0F65_002028 [Lagenidium giganteum]|uniref:Uncharacterized protein n=1 Tax=Lagenidium giganteum TaxID=4803 RepID=A0AAV2Z324_9STRA|nr:TPA: hypothetical protein N0F65_002028 [Lagenidium giganteum]
MPISDKLGKPFGLLSLICKNKKDDDRLQQPHHRSNHVGHASASSTPMSASASSSSVRGAFNPNPTGGHYGVKGGAARPSYYAGSSVQYERLTPAAPSHESQNHPSPAQVQYEPLRPSSRPPPVPTSAALNTAYAPVRLPSPQVQYERLSSSAAPAQPSSLMPPHRLNSPSQFEPTLPAPIRANSPVAYEPVNVRQHSPVVYDRLSPSINATTGMLSSSSQPVPPLAAALKQDPRSLHSPAVAGGQRPYETSMDTPTIKSERGTPGYSDKSTPFSVVMEEWMSQLRTPTPDVTLLPSPYDFNSDMPTPMERVDGFKQLQEALLPTPPPDVHDQTQSTKSNEYVLSSAARRPLVEDIASLCRDLISQEITDSRSKAENPRAAVS